VQPGRYRGNMKEEVHIVKKGVTWKVRYNMEGRGEFTGEASGRRKRWTSVIRCIT
jgi:hypothetical protein